MPVNSHVQIPASIMKGFFIKGKTKETFVFEIKEIENNTIKSEKIKEYGTVYAYYDDDTEKALSKVETDFGNVKTKIINSAKSDKHYSICDADKINISIFLQTLISRNRTMASRIQYGSLFCDLFGIQNTASDPINITLKMYPNGEFFAKFNMSIMFNNSKNNLVCPENCLFSPLHQLSYFNNNPCMLFPLSPKIALIISESNMKNIIIDADDVISSINEDALLSVYTTYSTFLISSTKLEIEKLKLLIDNDSFQKRIYLLRYFEKIEMLKIEDIESLPKDDKDFLMKCFIMGTLPDRVSDKLKKCNFIKEHYK